MNSALNRAGEYIALIVDDLPDNLAVLHDALDEAGYAVLVATSGAQALMRASQAMPDIVLLDAMMPEMDGFEVARLLKADPRLSHVPIIFMTGLTDTEHIVKALEVGAVDYITKPIKPIEVLARMNVHLQGARLARQARLALDAFGCATFTVQMPKGRVVWQTPLARELLQTHFTDGPARIEPDSAPAALVQWLAQATAQAEPIGQVWTTQRGKQRLTFTLQQPADQDQEWLIVVRETSDAAVIAAIGQGFQLTAREAEALYWVVRGKTNKDIGEIVGSSPMTVKKHLERVFNKLGVETRTAAAGMAIRRIRQTYPQFEG